MRKMLSPAFSQRGLLEQEEIISRIVDKFVNIMGEKAGPGSKGLNMTKWYEMNTFDILGEMAFGESFHSLDAGEFMRAPLSLSMPTNMHIRRSALLVGHCPRPSLRDRLPRQHATDRLAFHAYSVAYPGSARHQKPELPLRSTTG